MSRSTIDYCQECYDIEDKIVMAYDSIEDEDGWTWWLCEICLDAFKYKRQKETGK